MLQTFRILSLIEGFSLISLLFIAMPAKYQLGIDYVWIVGMTHGLLWMAYVFLSLTVSHQEKWSVLFWSFSLLTSILPFGCFLLERQFKKDLVQAEI